METLYSNIPVIEPVNATFRLVSSLVVDDIASNKRIYEGLSADEVYTFTIELQKSWFDSVFALKESSGLSLKYEVFEEFFSDDISNITPLIMGYCSNPSRTADDELPNYEDALLGGLDLDSICEYFSISTSDILKLLFVSDGIEIDSVTIDPDLINYVDYYKSGEYDEEYFKEAMGVFDQDCPMFEIGLHMVSKVFMDNDDFLANLIREYGDNVPGIDELEDAEYGKLEQLCEAFIASLEAKFGSTC